MKNFNKILSILLLTSFGLATPSFAMQNGDKNPSCACISNDAYNGKSALEHSHAFAEATQFAQQSINSAAFVLFQALVKKGRAFTEATQAAQQNDRYIRVGRYSRTPKPKITRRSRSYAQ